MGGGAKLDVGSGAGYVVMAPDQAAEAFGQWIDEAFRCDVGRDNHQCAVAAVFSKASSPRNPGLVEGALKDSV